MNDLTARVDWFWFRRGLAIIYARRLLLAFVSRLLAAPPHLLGAISLGVWLSPGGAMADEPRALAVLSRDLSKAATSGSPPAALRVAAIDSQGNTIDAEHSHVSIAQELPPELKQGGSAIEDRYAVRWVLAGEKQVLPKVASIVSLRENGSTLDALEEVPLLTMACPRSMSGLTCRVTPPIRATWDTLEPQHPALRHRALRARVGGSLDLLVSGTRTSSLRVGGPREGALKQAGHLDAKVKVRLLRQARGGPPPVGKDDRAAMKIAREELQAASDLWGQCGFTISGEVAIVDPPKPHLLAIGCDLGMVASGGEVRFRAGQRLISFRTVPGSTPTIAAHGLSHALERAGFSPVVRANAPIRPGALRTVDLLVRDQKGQPVEVGLANDAPLSSDATLSVCLGALNLEDGLSHFNDLNASAGTLEERALIKAFDDGDPTTIEVYVVPSFASLARVGESFIVGDGSSIRNAIVIDRAGLLAGSRSYVLAHELGHVLLDMPGHPDDSGFDHGTSLMDADASDASVFGPRRLSQAECERALLQSGPGTPVPLLTAVNSRQRPLPGLSSSEGDVRKHAQNQR